MSRRPSTSATRRPASRRAELISIAAGLFAEHGFAGVTVDDIGAAAGVSGPALYHHFASKEALLGEMLVDVSGTLLYRGLAIVESEPVDGLERLIAMHAAFAVDQRSLITVYHRDVVHVAKPDRRRIRDLQRDYVEVWVGVLLDQHAMLDPDSVRAAVHATIGLLNSTPFSGTLGRDDMIPLLSAMADGALRAAVDRLVDAAPALESVPAPAGSTPAR